ncbi:MAG: lasso peptide biosynthesis B2 protein [Actinomycetota bacterium]|nr:lasso peptide biosynthesis B2 protein [Actinomycetota bacterium]
MRSAARLLRKFLALPPRKQAVLIQAAILLASVRISLKTMPFQKARSLVDRISESSGSANKPEAVEDIVWAVDVLGKRMPGSCLTQAFAARILLGRRGVPTRLHIGAVKEEGGRFLAHAWLESNGQIVIGGHELERYTPLVSLEK